MLVLRVRMLGRLNADVPGKECLAAAALAEGLSDAVVVSPSYSVKVADRAQRLGA